STKNLARKDSATPRVRSVEPESRTTISSAQATLASVRARLASSFSVMMTTERVKQSHANRARGSTETKKHAARIRRHARIGSGRIAIDWAAPSPDLESAELRAHAAGQPVADSA